MQTQISTGRRLAPCSRLARGLPVPPDLPQVIGKSGNIQDFEFNSFDDNMLVSASEDMTIKIWPIPDGGIKQHIRDFLMSMEGHGKKASFCTFNPSFGCTINFIIVSVSFDQTCRTWHLAELEALFNGSALSGNR